MSTAARAHLTSTAAAVLVLAAGAYAADIHGNEMTHDSMPAQAAPAADRTADRLAIHDAVARVAHGVDGRDWANARAQFTDRVDVDYTSLAGGQPANVTADEMIAGWRGVLPGFASTQHLWGPVVVEFQGDGEATARYHGRATHTLPGAPGGESWVVGGHYTQRLARGADGRWRIASTRLDVAYQEGNLELPKHAAARVSGSAPR